MSGCAADNIVNVSADHYNETIRAAVGQNVFIKLGNIGPAEYESPPQISTAAITLLGVDVVPPFTPGGPTQQFRFHAAEVGTAVIHFRRMLGSSVVGTVDDTVDVR